VSRLASSIKSSSIFNVLLICISIYSRCISSQRAAMVTPS
jgi:hypothetical protein